MLKKYNEVCIIESLRETEILGGNHNGKKTAIITGASSGIGKEFAKLHAFRGGNLVIVARSKDKLNELKKELENKYNINVMIIVKDLSLSNSAQEIYDEVKNANIKIDYLINNL